MTDAGLAHLVGLLHGRLTRTRFWCLMVQGRGRGYDLILQAVGPSVPEQESRSLLVHQDKTQRVCNFSSFNSSNQSI
jgi:hypothetical protein